MVAERVARSLGVLCLATCALSCAGSGETADAPIGIAAVVDNGLSANGLSANGLSANGLSANGLSANGLSANGLSANGLSANGLSANGLSANGLTAGGLLGNGATALADPMALQFLKYVVSCALGPQQSLSFTVAGITHTFPGQVGLAPQWGGDHGSCDGSCQRWVSACVLARVDAAGVEREISIRGPSLALRRPGASSPVTRSARRPTSATSSSLASRATSASRPGRARTSASAATRSATVR